MESHLEVVQGSYDVRKLVVKDKLRNLWIRKGEPIITYLSKFNNIWDELAGVDEIVVDNDHVSLALVGFHKSWENF